jgi:hypothetical protein
MSTIVAPSPVDALLNSVDGSPARQAKATLNSVDPEMTLRMAKAQLGGAFRLGVVLSGAQFKEFGDKGRVSRVCAGDEIPDWLARAWARDSTRKQFVLALVDASGFFETRLQIAEKRRA